MWLSGSTDTLVSEMGGKSTHCSTNTGCTMQIVLLTRANSAIVFMEHDTLFARSLVARRYTASTILPTRVFRTMTRRPEPIRDATQFFSNTTRRLHCTPSTVTCTHIVIVWTPKASCNKFAPSTKWWQFLPVRRVALLESTRGQ